MKLVPGGLDQLFLFAVVALVAIGLVMVFSASSVTSLEDYGDKFHFFKRQVIFALLGALGMFFFAVLDYRRLEALAMPALILAFTLLLMVFIPGIGVTVRGATRWVQLGPIRVTPSAVAEFAMILFLAHSLSANHRLRDNFREYVLPNLVILGGVFLLVLRQPDLSSAIIVSVVSMVIIAIAHEDLKSILGLVGVGLAAVAFLVANDPMRMKRMLAFINPWADRYGAGYHVIQSFLALGSGGLTGVGLGQSRQKFEYLPDEFTDFIFAVIGEEMGFIGAIIVVLLFGILVWRGIRASLAAPDLFGLLLGFGLTCAIGFQSWFNVAVVVGCMPTTGVALPFISYGGTSLIMFMCAAGVLLNISWVGEKEKYRRVTNGWGRTES